MGQGHGFALGDGPNEMGNNLPSIDLGGTFDVHDMQCAHQFNCVADTDGYIKCWGRNDKGQLGYEDTNNRGDNNNEMGTNLAQVMMGPNDDNTDFLVASTDFPSGYGGNHMALCSDGDLTVKTWGDNTYGQLGRGGYNDGNIGDQSNEMGGDLEGIDMNRDPTSMPTADPSVSPTPAPTTIDQPLFSVGLYQTCMAYNDEAKCWGRNDVMDPSYIGGSVNYSTTPPIDGFNLGTADGSFDVYDIRCGLEHTCAFSSSGYARCWGMFHVLSLYAMVRCEIVTK